MAQKINSTQNQDDVPEELDEALLSLEEKGLIESFVENGERLYRLTDLGRAAVERLNSTLN